MGVGERIPIVVDSLPGGKQMINAVDFVVNWARANSLWPLTYGTACCAIEMMAASMPRYDISRFGSEVFRATPRQADLILLAGTIVEKMAEPLRTLYEQLPGPKYVIAMGACTISGGPFYYDNYSVIKGADRLIPVDVFIPGCPPRPEALFHGLMTLQAKIKRESIRNPWTPGPINTTPVINKHAQAAEEWAEQEKRKDAEMAEERKAFKEAHPDHKPYRIPKADKPDFPEVARRPIPFAGMPNSRVLALVRERFADIPLQTGTDPEPAALDAEGGDRVLDFVVPPEQYIAFVTFVKEHPELKLNFLTDLTAVDRGETYELVVYLRSVPAGHGLIVRVPTPRHTLSEAEAAELICPDAALPTLTGLYPAANWHEREVFDLMGIRFDGHPDLRRIFLKDDFAGHPLRKTYTNPNVVQRPY